jgi:FixJ family two-component response regulator
MQAGAIDFVEKPFDNELLLDRIQRAVAENARAGSERIKRIEVTKRIQLLTPREREVLDLVVAGQTNKGIARHLDISERTVEIHRANVMRKMQAKSLASLVKMATNRHGT